MRTGLEPATPGVTGRYSNQLNYRTNCSDLCVFLERGCKDTQKIRTSKFFAYLFNYFFSRTLFDLDFLSAILDFRLLEFWDCDLENTVSYMSFNVLLVCIIRQQQSLTEF